MDHDKLEQYIYDEDINAFDILNALIPFYRYTFYRKIAEKRRLSIDNDALELALNIIDELLKLKKSIIEVVPIFRTGR
ncbi:hypothetical protein [Acetobacter persici]|uniref:hypothetical protein n=1 Tax=Acetobacter persici TaxID=1076596 RepID=UPI001F1EBBDA|nr:hypothetical protein [Acetobacter persici]MCG0996848.1 hypothetical protein [Acetobacter persici]